MDANEYQSLRSGKNILDFATLKETQSCLLETGYVQLAQGIAQLLVNKGIDRTVYHNKTGEQHADYYRVDLPAADIEVIVSVLFDKEVNALNANFETTSANSFYASLLNKWNGLIT